MKNDVPGGLRFSFVMHFVIDWIFALPLFFFPGEVLGFFGWGAVDPISARIVAAALFAIGLKSLTGRNESVEVYKSMINLKLLWSFFAMAGLLYSVLDGSFGNLWVGWSLFGVFFLFHLLWWFWRGQIKD